MREIPSEHVKSLLEVYRGVISQDECVFGHIREPFIVKWDDRRNMYEYDPHDGTLYMSIDRPGLEFLLEPLKLDPEGTDIFARMPILGLPVGFVFYGVKKITPDYENPIIEIQRF